MNKIYWSQFTRFLFRFQKCEFYRVRWSFLNDQIQTKHFVLSSLLFLYLSVWQSEIWSNFSHFFFASRSTNVEQETKNKNKYILKKEFNANDNNMVNHEIVLYFTRIVLTLTNVNLSCLFNCKTRYLKFTSYIYLIK